MNRAAKGCELGRRKPHGVIQLGKLSGPVVGADAGLPAYQARWQMGHAFERLGVWYLGAHQGGFAGFIDAMHGEDVLCQVDSNGYDGRHFPYQVS